MEKIQHYQKPLAMPTVVNNLRTILQRTHFCTLCFDTKEELLHLDYSLVIEEQETLTLRELLEGIFGHPLHLLTSDYICEACKSLAYSSYAFIKATKRNISLYSKYVEHLHRETTELSASLSTDWKRAVIVLDNYENIQEPEGHQEPEECQEPEESQEPEEPQDPLELEPQEIIKNYVCDKCGREYIRKTYLIKHLQKHKNGCSKGCPHCNVTPCIHEKYILAFYEQQHARVRPKSCLCGYEFGRTLSYLIAHVNKEHLNMKPSICETCGKSFHVKSLYQKHLQITNHLNKKLVCEFCFRKYERAKQLEIHLTTCAVTEKPFQCIKCPVLSENKRIHQSHMATHSEYRKRLPKQSRRSNTYKCQTCGKTLNTKLELRLHTKTHEKKPNLCLYCNQQCNSRQDYLDHVQSDEHKKNMPYSFRHQCAQCDYSAHKVSLLRAHINRIHLNIKPFQCEYCNKRFFDSTQLDNHVKIHTEVPKPKVCDICGARLACATTFKKHRRLHTKEFPYSCPYCDVKANCASTIKTHIMTKHMEPTIQCPLCDSKFHTMINARGHVKKVHWKSKEKFDYTKLKGLAPEDYEFFRDRRKTVEIE